MGYGVRMCFLGHKDGFKGVPGDCEFSKNISVESRVGIEGSQKPFFIVSKSMFYPFLKIVRCSISSCVTVHKTSNSFVTQFPHG